MTRQRISSGGAPLGWVHPGLLIAVVVTAGCEPDAPVQIGVTTSSVFIDAARMAVEDDVEANGPLPAVDTVYIYDASNRAKPAIAAADSFASRENMIAVVGHSNSAASLAASQIYNAQEIVQVAPNSSASVYSQAGPFSFRLVPPDDGQGGFLADYLVDRFPEGGRLGVMYVNDDYGRGILEAFLEALDTTRFDVAARVPHSETELDAATRERSVATIVASRPDVIVWLARGQVLHAYLPAIRTALGDVPIVGSDATSSGRGESNLDGRWDGVVTVDFVDLTASSEGRAFRRRWKERFGPVVSGAHALTYDAVRLVLSGIREGADSGEALRRYLMDLGRGRPPFRGVTGAITFDAEGDVARSYVVRLVHPPDSAGSGS